MSAYRDLVARGDSHRKLTMLEFVLYADAKAKGGSPVLREAAEELAAKNKAIESAIKALRAVVHDRPTAHTDEVWNQISSALVELETLK